MKLLSAAAFRHRIDCQRPVLGTASALGDRATNWLTVYSRIPAEVENLGGSELVRAQQIHAEGTSQITFWYKGDIDTTWRFIEYAKEGARYHYPVSVTHDGNHRQMQFLCKERPNG